MSHADELLNLKDKWVLITGASSGVGRETARWLAKLGTHLVLIARNEERLAAVKTEAEGYGVQCQTIAFDLTQLDNLPELVARIEADKLDGVVLNAGTFDCTPLKFSSLETIERLFTTNYNSPVLLLAALLRKKKVRKGGSVVFISSIGVHLGVAGQGLYSGSKAALASTAKNFAYELSSQRIRVNVLTPAMLQTPFVDKDETSFLSKDNLEYDSKGYPMGYGTNEDAARSILYFLSDLSPWTTGSELIIDGGLMCR